MQPEPQHVGLPCIGQLLRRAADGVMHQVRGEPVGHEHAEDAAVVERVAVDVGKAFPRHDRLQRRRLQIGDEPLVDGVVGNAGEPDLAVAPWLRRRPFDGVVEIDRLRERPRLALPRRFSAAAPVDAHRGVAARHPPFRVHRLPVHVGVRLFLQRRRRNPELVLLVRPEIEQRGEAPVVIRPEHVGLEPRAVAHRHVDVLLDQQLVSGRRSRLHFHDRYSLLITVILRCERSEPRRATAPASRLASFEARAAREHLRMTVNNLRCTDQLSGSSTFTSSVSFFQ